MKNIGVFLLALALAACAPKRPAIVDEVGTKPHRTHTQSYSKNSSSKVNKKTHRVVKGESLYSIGFRYQIDYKTLASYNGIKPPYRIYPNQILKLSGTVPKNQSYQTSNKNQVVTKPLNNTQPINAKSTTTKNSSKPSQTNQQTKSHNQQESKNKVNKPIAKTPAKIKTPNKSNLDWLWPTKGRIRTTFLASNPARKGISISGKEGQEIKAAEAGVVVYSGNGLLGYGELVIIKHNDTYLSAYGHNKLIKVKEGQTVTRGQVIAELGSTGTNVNNLHFEIRKNGTPVNPLNYVKP